MYGNPRKKDPYAERQPIPPYIERSQPYDPSGAVAAATAALILAAGFFSLGYMSGIWGWFL